MELPSIAGTRYPAGTCRCPDFESHGHSSPGFGCKHCLRSASKHMHMHVASLHVQQQQQPTWCCKHYSCAPPVPPTSVLPGPRARQAGVTLVVCSGHKPARGGVTPSNRSPVHSAGYATTATPCGICSETAARQYNLLPATVPPCPAAGC
jgi:hypothetical protein